MVNTVDYNSNFVTAKAVITKRICDHVSVVTLEDAPI